MSAHSQQNHTPALVVLTTLFFMMGFITCMNDILIPHLKDIFRPDLCSGDADSILFLYRLCDYVDPDGLFGRQNRL